MDNDRSKIMLNESQIASIENAIVTLYMDYQKNNNMTAFGSATHLCNSFEGMHDYNRFQEIARKQLEAQNE